MDIVRTAAVDPWLTDAVNIGKRPLPFIADAPDGVVKLKLNYFL